MATNVPVTMDTPIVVKILFRGQTKKFKLPLKDLGAHVLPEKVSPASISCLGRAGVSPARRASPQLSKAHKGTCIDEIYGI